MQQINILSESEILHKIHTIRGVRVMVDRDLAQLYGVTTRTLNQAVKRHSKRFPEDFMFKLTKEEFDNWKSQFVISNNDKMGLRKIPNVFSEQGVAMLSGVLNSDTAIDVNIQIIRIFSKFREIIANNNEVLLKLEKIQSELFKNTEKLNQHDEDILVIFKYLKKLLNPKNGERESIGYKSDLQNNKK